MELNRWTSQFHILFDSAVAKYQAGERGADSYFDNEGKDFLASIGLRPIQLFDYAEDFVNGGEPDWDTVLLIVAARRDYLKHEMDGKWTADPINSAALPAKSESYAGIVWLPRIIQKAEAFLQGALPPETMYCCGGDRRFLKQNRIHPADFLRIVWAMKGDKDKLAEYIKSHPEA